MTETLTSRSTRLGALNRCVPLRAAGKDQRLLSVSLCGSARSPLEDWPRRRLGHDREACLQAGVRDRCLGEFRLQRPDTFASSPLRLIAGDRGPPASGRVGDGALGPPMFAGRTLPQARRPMRSHPLTQPAVGEPVDSQRELVAVDERCLERRWLLFASLASADVRTVRHRIAIRVGALLCRDCHGGSATKA